MVVKLVNMQVHGIYYVIMYFTPQFSSVLPCLARQALVLSVPEVSCLIGIAHLYILTYHRIPKLRVCAFFNLASIDNARGARLNW